MSPIIKRLFIALIAILLLAVVILAVLRFLPKKEAGSPRAAATPASGLAPAGNLPTAPGAAAGVNAPASAEILAGLPAANDEALLQNALVVAARDFAERYGSYSTEGDYENLEILLPSMTDKFRSQTETQIAKNRKTGSKKSVGVTTKALSVKPEEAMTKGNLNRVRVLTERLTTANGATTISYEELVLTFLYQESLWKADSAEWVKS
ncbi:hypothetical protein EPN90_04715 [Patescibacteria group bacterium]|nr:MAG: hypothetical protein EPN90_04715 [Patescibacteria group bacterium]